MKTLHPSLERLLRATQLSPSELAKALDTTPQVVTNWGTRGVSKSGVLKAEREFGIDMGYIIDGVQRRTNNKSKVSLARNVKILRELNNLSQDQLAEKIGKSQAAIQKIEAGLTLRPRFLQDLANALGVSSIDLEYKDFEKELKKQAIESDIGTMGKFRLWSSNDPLPEDEYAYLPFFKDVEFQGGTGCCEMQDYNGFRLPFAKSTLHRYGVPLDQAFCVTLTGNSMEPVIPKGSTLGINKADTVLKEGDIYAIRQDDLFRVKRLYHAPNGMIRISSFNQEEYKDELVRPENIEIIGRVFTYQVML